MQNPGTTSPGGLSASYFLNTFSVWELTTSQASHNWTVFGKVLIILSLILPLNEPLILVYSLRAITCH